MLEFQDAHPTRSIFILWGLREFPRLTVLYMFFIYNQEVFQPLLYYTSDITDIEEHIYEVRYNMLLSILLFFCKIVQGHNSHIIKADEYTYLM